MSKEKSIFFTFFEKTNIFDLIFYISFLALIILTIIMDKDGLLYILPITIFTIMLKYISLTKTNIKLLFIFALLIISASDILFLYHFKDYFIIITSLTSIALISFTLLLKTYLNKGRLQSLLSLSLLVTITLVSYIIYSIFNLITNYLPDNQLFFAYICTSTLIVYAATATIIYINDNYENGTILLASGIFSCFQIFLTPINEFLHHNKVFTILIIFSHIMALYLFMMFIAQTKAVKAKNVRKKYI